MSGNIWQFNTQTASKLLRFPPYLHGTPQADEFLDALSQNNIPFIGRFIEYMAP
jgi:hypothetical protein